MEAKRLRLLMVEDSEDDATLILRQIGKSNYIVDLRRVETAEDLRSALRTRTFDLVLSDHSLPSLSSFDALRILQEEGIEIPFIIVSGAIGEETAVQLMRMGATDYVWKDKLARLVPVIQQSLQNAEVRRQRREAEQALKLALNEAETQRMKIDSIIKSVPEGLLVCDLTHRIVLINHAAELLLGVRSEDVLGMAAQAVFEDVEMKKQFHKLISQLEIGAHAPKVFLELPLPGSKFPRVIQAKTSDMVDREGSATGTVTILHDVTRERELDRMKSEFISTAAHELSTPLTAIIGYAELLLKPEDYGGFSHNELHEFVNEILDKGLTLSRIVDELLDISRIERGQGLQLTIEPCDLAGMIRKTVMHFQRQAQRHVIELKLSNGLPAEFMLDGPKIIEVLENLLGNAIKYSPEGGRIIVRCAMSGENLHCSVEDEGIGMTPEQINKVFDKFYRVDASDTAVKGLGLGLCIAKQIVTFHGGRIWLESEPDKGTTAYFTVPRRAMTAPAGEGRGRGADTATCHGEAPVAM